jgi:lysophospholipase L1-like esterase
MGMPSTTTFAPRLLGLLLATLVCPSGAVALALPYVAPASSPLVSWAGRTVPNATTSSVTFDWVGTSATVTVNNSASFTTLSVTVSDTCSNGNKFVVRMSAQGTRLLPVSTFYTSVGTNTYTLFASAGRLTFWGETATFSITKAVEARFTQCSSASPLTVLSFSADAPFLTPPPVTRRIEAIGDSITCGDLVYCRDPVGDPMPVNNSLWADDATVAWPALLGVAFDAAVSTVAWGGMGMVAGDVRTWTWPSIPDVYGSALAWDVMVRGQGAPLAYPWDFSRFVPDAVVANLGTNDAAGERFSNATFAALFVSTYVSLLKNATASYASARGGKGPALFVGCGPMTSVYAAPALEVVATLQAAGLDATYLNMSLPAGQGCQCGHPSATDHQQIANSIRPVVAKVMGW